MNKKNNGLVTHLQIFYVSRRELIYLYYQDVTDGGGRHANGMTKFANDTIELIITSLVNTKLCFCINLASMTTPRAKL